jgi:Methyltransferase domain
MTSKLLLKIINTKIGSRLFAALNEAYLDENVIQEEKLDSMAPLVKKMAQTGIGTNACLELGCLPMLVHFYTPVPDIREITDRGVFDARSSLTGIEFQPERQLELLALLGNKFGAECHWPLEQTDADGGFYLSNGSFSFGCAAALHCMIRNFKPKRIIEVGSGNSSLVIASALENNRSERKSAEYTIIDPYPKAFISAEKFSETSNLVVNKVELTDVKQFEILQENDMLFIDSGHTVKIGSDVNFLILDVLPRLRPGVIVHFHDINLPFAPPQSYYTNPAFRVFWTEEYLLQAFLSCNNDFEILLAMNWVQTEHMEDFCSAFPHFDLATNWAKSGSFWIRRKPH